MFPRLHTLAFEELEDAGAPDVGDEAVGDADPGAADAGATADAAAVAPEPDAQPDWYGSPEFQQAVEYTTEQTIAQMLEQAQAGGELSEGEPSYLDPMADPQEFTQGLVGLLRQEIEHAIAPLLPMVERQQIGEAQGFVESTIERLPEVSSVAELLPAPDEGAEDTRSADAANLVEMMASGFLPAAEETYGEGGRAVEAALRAGAQHVQATLKSVYDAGRASREAELQTNAGTRSDSGAGAGAAEIDETAGDEMAWAERVGNRYVTS